MRRLISICLLSLMPSYLEAAVARVGSANCSGSPGSGESSFSSTFTATTSGNLLVFAYLSDSSAPTGIKLTGCTVALSTATSVATPIWSGIGYVANVPASCSSITITSGFNGHSLCAAEYSGVQTSSPLDQVSTNDNGFGSANPWTSNATATLAATTDLAVGWATQWRTVVGGGTQSATGSWTANGTQYGTTNGVGAYIEDILGTGSTTGVAATGNFSNVASQQIQASVATFLAAGAAAAATSETMPLMGI